MMSDTRRVHLTLNAASWTWTSILSLILSNENIMLGRSSLESSSKSGTISTNIPNSPKRNHGLDSYGVTCHSEYSRKADLLLLEVSVRLNRGRLGNCSSSGRRWWKRRPKASVAVATFLQRD